MTDIMVDLETLSTAYNARILAIGAVKFNTGQGVYDKFYQPVANLGLEILPQKDYVDEEGFHISSDTLGWWERQSPKARAVFTDPNAVSVRAALTGFYEWATADGAAKDNRLWGNGASFDNVILSTAYDLCDMHPPWMFYNDRCYRTVKNLYPHVDLVRTGTYHNALDDAESQAIHLLTMGCTLK